MAETEEPRAEQAEGGVEERNNDRETREKDAGPAEIPEAPRGDDTHIEEEQGEHAGEEFVCERHEGDGARTVAGKRADDQAADEQKNGAVEKRVAADVAPVDGFDIGGIGAGFGRALGGEPGEDDADDDGGRFHERHRGDHVAGIRDFGGVEKGGGGDERDGADGAIGGGDGGGVGGVEFQPQDEVGVDRHHDRRDHRDAQGGGDLKREPAVGEFDAALEADREEQVERKNFRQRRRQFEVAFDEGRDEPEQEEQNGRAEKIRQQLVEIHRRTIIGKWPVGL